MRTENNEEREGRDSEARQVEGLMGTLDRRPVHLPALRQAVMARIRRERASPWIRAWQWLAAPQLSPLAAGIALAAGVALLLWLRPFSQIVTKEAESGTVPIRLVFLAPQAATVAVTGDFARWDPHGIPLTRPQGDGAWSVELQLPPGLHHYVFIVDGTEWRPDPNAASQVDDGFGQKNSVLLVPGPRIS
jgi:AMP-activated protein kinase-like protein